MSTVEIMMEISNFGDDPSVNQQLFSLRKSLGWGNPADQLDPTERKIHEAIAAIEALCKPALSERPPI